MCVRGSCVRRQADTGSLEKALLSSFRREGWLPDASCSASLSTADMVFELYPATRINQYETSAAKVGSFYKEGPVGARVPSALYIPYGVGRTAGYNMRTVPPADMASLGQMRIRGQTPAWTPPGMTAPIASDPGALWLTKTTSCKDTGKLFNK